MSGDMLKRCQIFEARHCPAMPVDCVDYGVISHVTGKEVCRVWTEDDARLIADLLNTRAAPPPLDPEAGELCERLLSMAPRPDDGGEARANRKLYVEAASLITALSARLVEAERKLAVLEAARQSVSTPDSSQGSG